MSDSEFVKTPFDDTDNSDKVFDSITTDTESTTENISTDTTESTTENKTESTTENKTENTIGIADNNAEADKPVSQTGIKKENKSAGGKKKPKIFNTVTTCLIAVLSVILVISLFFLFRNLHDKVRGNEIYGDASEIMNDAIQSSHTGSKTDGNSEGDGNVLTPYDKLQESGDTETANAAADLTSIKATLSALKSRNSDVVGWIYVEDSKINYPLMQHKGGDSDYYLTHAYTGEYLAVGSIFMPNDLDTKFENNYNTLIYGHNVQNGTMFHDVLSFADEEIFNSKLIYIYTLDGEYVYKPFSIYETTADYNYIQTKFYSEKEYLDFAATVKANSLNANDVSISSGDTMITLSTCINALTGTNGRWALHAKLISFTEG